MENSVVLHQEDIDSKKDSIKSHVPGKIRTLTFRSQDVCSAAALKLNEDKTNS